MATELEILREIKAARNSGDTSAELVAMRSLKEIRDTPTAEPEEAPELIDQLSRQAGLTVRAGVEGLTALPSLLAEPIRLGLNLIPGVQIAPQQEAVGELLTSFGVPEPETKTEKIVGGAAEAVAGAGGFVGVGKTLVEIAPTISRTLMASPGLQALSAGAGGGAASSVREEGGGVGSQLIAGTAASIAAPTAAGFAKVGLDIIKYPFSAIKASTKTPAVKATTDLAKALRDDGISVDQAIAKMKEAGPEAMVSDLGDNVSSLARRIESVPGLAKRIASIELTARQLNRNTRVNDAIKNSLGNGDEFFQTLDEINLIRKTASAPKYKEAYSGTVNITDEIKDLLNRPAVIAAWTKAKNIAANEGDALADDLVITDAGIEIVNPPSVKTYDYIKRGLDDVIQSHTNDFGRVTTDVGRSVQNVKRNLINAVDSQVPAYREARSLFSGHSANLDAMSKGRGFLKDDSEITTSILKSMGDSEREMFRTGAARAIRDKILSSPDGADAYKRIFGNDLIRAKIKSVFPDNRSFNEFSRTMKSERIMSATRNKVLGGSPTARISAEQEAAGFNEGAAEQLARGNVMAATVNQVKQILERIKTPDENVSNHLAGMLFTRDPDANIKILQGLEQTVKSLPQKQQESFSKAIIKAMAIQQANISAQVQAEEIQ